MAQNTFGQKIVTAEDGSSVIEYRARDDARASMRVFRVDDDRAPVVVCLPAMGVRGAYYTELARALGHSLGGQLSALSFELDSLAPRRSVDNFLCKLKASPVTNRHFSGNHPGLEKARHFDWARRPQRVVETIRAWVNETRL